MQPDDWDDARHLFAQALPLAASERERLLAGVCTGREPLRAEVESLLDAYQRAGGLLETGAASGRPAGAKGSLVGQRLGPYLLESVLGQGGMGVVYRARGDAPARAVAVKVMRPVAEPAWLMRRFERESRLLARLEHAHIARLLDVGETSDGCPYFVLELVEGRAIDRYCAEERLPLRARLDLFLTLCDAVAYAHGRLVVHRDLKPANVLVTPHGAPKLLDFGIAHLLDESQGVRATTTGTLSMTPAYASPEQMRGDSATVATDVHALGLLLHVLLTGRAAFQLHTGAADELVRVVCLNDAPAPSVDLLRPRTSSDCFEPVETPARLARLLRGDLDSIVARALRKEPQARYPSVAELHADVRRYLDGEPVRARGGRWRYRAGKFMRRQRLSVALGLSLLVTLVAGLVATREQVRIARAERARAERRFEDVRRLATSLLFDFHDAVRNLPGSTKARELVVAKALVYLEGLALEAGNDGPLRLELARAYQRVGTVQGLPGQANLGDAVGAERSLARAWALLGQAEAPLRERPEYVLAAIEIANDLGLAQRQLGRFETLLPRWQAAERTAASVRAEVASAALFAARVRLLGNITMEQERRGAFDEAEQAARSQLQTALDLRSRWPQDALASRVVGAAYRSLASIQMHLGHYADARASALAAVAIQRANVKPGDTGSARRLMHALIGLGKVERDGDLAQAEAAHAEALEIAAGLVAQDAANSTAVQDLAGILGNWCWDLDSAGQRCRGRDVCAEALRLAERTPEPRDAFTSMNLVSSRYFAAWQREIQGDRQTALLAYERALAASAAPILADSGPELRSVRAEIWSAIARAHFGLGQRRAALAAAQQALDYLGPITSMGRHDRDELETRLVALIVPLRASIDGVASTPGDTCAASLAAATAVAVDLRGLTAGLPRQRPVLTQLDALQARCLATRAPGLSNQAGAPL